jgi:hypothetical protein
MSRDIMQVPTVSDGPCRTEIRQDRFRPEFEIACQIADLIEGVNQKRRNANEMELNLCTLRMFAERMLNA